MSTATRINGTQTGGFAGSNGVQTRAKKLKAKSKSAKPTVHELSLDKIMDDTDLQPRTNLDLDVMREYTVAWLEDADFPPIVTFFDGELYWLADGFYRTRSARKAMKTSIKSLVYDGTKRDAKLYSAGANVNHGLRRSNEDKKKAIIKLLDDAEWCVWTDDVIAGHCRVSPGMVQRYRENSPGLKGHSIGARIGADGEIHTTKTNGTAAAPDSANGIAPETFHRPPTLMSKVEVAGKFVGKIAKHLKKSDPATRINAAYEFGECEIATSTHMYCFTGVGDKSALYNALGRMMLCKACLNPKGRIVIIGHFPRSVGNMIAKLATMGVECRTPEQILAE